MSTFITFFFIKTYEIKLGYVIVFLWDSAKQVPVKWASSIVYLILFQMGRSRPTEI